MDGKGTCVDIEYTIQILHERRKGHDILALPFERKTRFAQPDGMKSRRVVKKRTGEDN
jgi:hypothetical protein